MTKIGLLGCGSWGTTLAQILAKKGETVNAWHYRKDFVDSIERVASVSLDRKEGVKLSINRDNIQLSVNSANSGEGNEKIKAEFSSENLNISFNSKYLIDIANEVEDKNLKMNLKDSTSPVLIEDISDKNSYYVIMPMKI